MSASVNPVIALVAPGPDVTKTQPTLPVDRAYPSAACTAACSCLTNMCLIFLLSNIASYKGKTAPPGYPNITSTPFSTKAFITASAPVIVLSAVIFL